MVSPWHQATSASGAVADLLNPESTAEELEGTLGEVERRLLSLVQDGARGAEELAAVQRGLDQVALEIREIYLRLHEVQGRRDVGFQTTARIEAVRRHCLWLYRKARLEQCFFAKLRLERDLRDTIFRQIVETYQEMASLEEVERDVRARQDDALAQELLRESQESSP